MLPKENPTSEQKDKSAKKTLLGSLGVVGVLLLKFKFYLMAGLKALAFIKISWIISPLLTIGFYTMFFGLPYAIAIFVLLLFHEMGHWIWMKALGLQPNMPVFLPFVAYVSMTKLPPDEATRAWVAMAGPLVGGVTSAALFWFGVHNTNSWMMAAGSTGFFLNLFQLVPAKPFDGGFIIQAISKWLLIPGVVILIALTIVLQSPILFLIAIISVVSLYGQLKAQRAAKQQSENASIGNQSGYSLEKQKDSPFEQPGSQKQSPLPDSALAVSMAAAVPSRLPSLPVIPMQPANTEQRILIAIAYIGLAACLAWLYRLSSDELTVFLPHHK